MEKNTDQNEVQVRYFVYGGWLPGDKAIEGDKILRKYKPIKDVRESFFWGGATFNLDEKGLDNLISDLINSPSVQQIWVTPKSNINRYLQHLQNLQLVLSNVYSRYMEFKVDDDKNVYDKSLDFMVDGLTTVGFIKIPSHHHQMGEEFFLEYFKRQINRFPTPKPKPMPKGFI